MNEPQRVLERERSREVAGDAVADVKNKGTELVATAQKQLAGQTTTCSPCARDFEMPISGSTDSS